jgi:hypothetical protein
MLPKLAEHVTGLEWEQAREAVGRVLGLATPVPAAALRRAMVEDAYCQALLAAPSNPARAQQLVNDPRNGPFTLPGDGVDAAGASTHSDSTSRLMIKAGAALTRWAASGFATVDQETFERRWGACTVCPELVEAPDSWVYKVTMSSKSDSRICGACGCVAIRKARVASERCPRPDPARPGLNRWGEGG